MFIQRIFKPQVESWRIWAEMPKAELWQAVLLSVDLSPDDVELAFDWLNGSANQVHDLTWKYSQNA